MLMLAQNAWCCALCCTEKWWVVIDIILWFSNLFIDLFSRLLINAESCWNPPKVPMADFSSFRYISTLVFNVKNVVTICRNWLGLFSCTCSTWQFVSCTNHRFLLSASRQSIHYGKCVLLHLNNLPLMQVMWSLLFMERKFSLRVTTWWLWEYRNVTAFYSINILSSVYSSMMWIMICGMIHNVSK